MNLSGPPILRNYTIELGWYHKMKFCVLLTMFVMSLGTNVFVLAFAYRIRRIKSTLNILIIHLCYADILAGILCMFGECLWILTIQWNASSWLCKFYKFSISFSISLSTGIICVMSIDRTLVIMYPLNRLKMAKRIKILIGIMYMGSCLINISQVTMFDTAQAPAPYPLPFIQCVHISLFMKVQQWRLKVVFWMHYVFNYALPLIIIIVCYSLILTRLKDASRWNKLNNFHQRYCFSKPPSVISMSQECSSSILSCKQIKENNSIILFSKIHSPTSNHSFSHNLKSKNTLFRRAKKKSIKLTFSIVLTFVVCWTPYYIVYFIRSYSGPIHRFDPRDPGIYSFFFGHLNAIINPIICGVFQLIQKARRV